MSEAAPFRLIAELRRQGIRDERVLAALLAVPRQVYVTAADRERAYDNTALAIEAGQTISQPYVVALMAQALAPLPHERLLEIGTGSGYGAAVLARLAAEVFSIERVPALTETARVRLAEQGVTNVHVYTGDGTLGWPTGAPYDGIVVTAAAPGVPPALLDQLDPMHGRLVIPVGDAEAQQLLLIRREPDGQRVHDLGPVRFVPLLGQQGWAED